MREIILRESGRFDLAPLLVASVILQESDGDPKRWRWEPGFFDKFIKDKSRERLGGHWPNPNICSEQTERIGRAISWGPMQVIGQNARENGFDGNLTELLEPQQGIYFGCAYLKKCMNKAGQAEHRALLYYNLGLSYSGADNGYPEKTLAHRDQGRAIRLVA